MPNPKAPRVRRTGRDTTTDLELVTNRLRALGATDDELDQVRTTWDEMDEDWTPERRAEFGRLPDAELRQAILDARAEYREATTTEQEEADAEAERQRVLLHGEAGARVEAAVPAVLEWVYEDVDTEPARALARAQAVLDVERAGRQRKTLTEPLEAFVAEQTEAQQPATAAEGPQDALLGVPGPNPAGAEPEASSGDQGGQDADAGGDGTPA